MKAGVKKWKAAAGTIGAALTAGAVALPADAQWKVLLLVLGAGLTGAAVYQVPYRRD